MRRQLNDRGDCRQLVKNTKGAGIAPFVFL